MSAETARNIESEILRALAERGQSATASSAGITPTRLSRWKRTGSDGGGLFLSEVAEVLAALGMIVVDTTDSETVTVQRDELDALRVLARRALAA